MQCFRKRLYRVLEGQERPIVLSMINWLLNPRQSRLTISESDQHNHDPFTHFSTLDNMVREFFLNILME